MEIILLKELHRVSFAHLMPVEIAQSLSDRNIVSLGLLEKKEDGYHPRGVLVTRVEEYITEILWIYVQPEFRRQGNGTLLLRAMTSLLEREGAPGFLMAFLEPDQENHLFFRAAGFVEEPDGLGAMFETTVGALVEGRLGKLPASGVIPFSRVPAMYLRAFNRQMADRASDYGLVTFPLRQEDYLPCSVAIIEKQKLTGLLLFAGDAQTDAISMVFRYVLGGDVRRAAALICSSIRAMEEQYPAQTRVRLATMDKLSQIAAETCAPPAEESSLMALTYRIKGGIVK